MLSHKKSYLLHLKSVPLQYLLLNSKLTTIRLNLCIVNYLQKGKPIWVIIFEHGVNDLWSKIYFNQWVKWPGTVEQKTV